MSLYVHSDTHIYKYRYFHFHDSQIHDFTLWRKRYFQSLGQTVLKLTVLKFGLLLLVFKKDVAFPFRIRQKSMYMKKFYVFIIFFRPNVVNAPMTKMLRRRNVIYKTAITTFSEVRYFKDWSEIMEIIWHWIGHPRRLTKTISWRIQKCK